MAIIPTLNISLALARLRVKRLFSSLEVRGVTFSEIEVVPFDDKLFAVNLLHGKKALLMEPNAEAGVDVDLHIATLKALSEFFERNAWRKGVAVGLPSSKGGGTDGYAAFPAVWSSRQRAKMSARKHALEEAIEHFTKANWWDNPAIGCECERLSVADFRTKCDVQSASVFDACLSLCSPLYIDTITPYLNAKGHKVVIFLWWFPEGGVTMGGACGQASNFDSIHLSAITELFRHILAVCRARKDNISPQASYDARLLHFGLGFSDLRVRERLNQRGSQTIQLPALAIDCEIDHEFADLAVVWRCFFEGQPEFLGGAIDRLCL